MDTPEEAKRGRGRSTTTRRYDAEGSRAALVSAAARCFGKYGYDGTSVRDIGRTAEVDAALVYRYFGSKQGLFEAVSTSSTALFEPLRQLPLDEVAEWLHRVAFHGPDEDEVPHPVLTMLRSPSREEAVGQLRADVTEVFTESFAARLDGPDAEIRAELLAAWMLGMTLLRLAVRTPALSAAPDRTLPYVRVAVDSLLHPGEPDDGAAGGCRCPVSGG
ncbi:TetR/AcrR family transcriptional regulator [Streptomyces griseoviridis]|uniref:TetR/AcrR family transcriptional regulator n=1 Tax=Streptomyces TaxID=1883 RepID=UPI0024756375|nr:TetR/AcrR family transcriptional regulator [Streptomyces sp. MAA16]MDH6697642.1 AcrR family transcriptional regulator [Streptomyces sp. MAA16]